MGGDFALCILADLCGEKFWGSLGCFMLLHGLNID